MTGSRETHGTGHIKLPCSDGGGGGGAGALRNRDAGPCLRPRPLRLAGRPVMDADTGTCSAPAPALTRRADRQTAVQHTLFTEMYRRRVSACGGTSCVELWCLDGAEAGTGTGAELG